MLPSILLNRRQCIIEALATTGWIANGRWLLAAPTGISNLDVGDSVAGGLSWLASQQSQLGHWNHEYYPTAITALAGMAFVCSGSTTVQGEYAKNIRNCVDFLMTCCRPNGLIGNPERDDRYTYGHGFAMLFLSQVLGEEEDADRRQELSEVLDRAVAFSVSAQTKSGGWGYVSGEVDDFDEGSTTVTQVQGLRGCRNAGIVVPKESIEKAIQYIYDCKNPDGGISYSSGTKGGSRAPITAAALAALYNAGDYESEHIPDMWNYCRRNLNDLNGDQYGHWHYTYLYYSQVVYRQGPKEWNPFRDKLYPYIIEQQQHNGSWSDSDIGDVYATACNLIILQLELGLLPIFQR
ncbi:MAG: prenyltransferase/squalene oxidase repeat-containing protein [Pirellulaceae bacterium]